MKPQDHRGKKFKRIVYPGPIMTEYGLKVHEILPLNCRMKFSIRFLRYFAFTASVFTAIAIYVLIRTNIGSTTKISVFEMAFQTTAYRNLLIGSAFMALLAAVFDYRWTWKSNAVAIQTLIEKGFCPNCGYKITSLTPDPKDNCTPCPECGHAWRINNPNP